MQEFRDYLEIAYFISGIVVAIAALIALYQIKIAKESLQTQSKRDALSLTASQCSHYNTRIIELQNKLYDKRVSSKCTFFDSSNWEIDTDGKDVLVKNVGKNKPSIDELDKVSQELLDVVNAMDSFAVYFTSNVADESVAYKSVANTFISTAERYMPWIIHAYNTDDYFANIIDLYVIWKNRKKQELLKTKMEHLKNELDKSTLKTEKPIGV
ncbi:hypothetical protein J4G63_15325 [Aeromonas sobria]|uniref:Uncharacterized protein n=1 Tax=Aeromonas sobria TaxID=646 RepID=A0A1S2CUQ8_AERSO|nr:hypothetical protein [Aeromonas sobria]MBS4688605.1 hypothetical protein [Aeromonas sobria]OHY92450.1 hypothetical protein BJD16_13270 [Aeromonas sobria]